VYIIAALSDCLIFYVIVVEVVYIYFTSIKFVVHIDNYVQREISCSEEAVYQCSVELSYFKDGLSHRHC